MPSEQENQEKLDSTQPNTEQTKAQPTVKQRVDAVIEESYHDKDMLKKKVFDLVQHILHPEQFCPNCDDRMFFDPATSVYNCANCGYQSPRITANIATTAGRVPAPTPVRGGPIPPQVEKAIAESEEAMKEVRIPTPNKLGEKIRKLVNDRDAGGPAAPTKEDEARVKNSSSSVASTINWV